MALQSIVSRSLLASTLLGSLALAPASLPSTAEAAPPPKSGSLPKSDSMAKTDNLPKADPLVKDKPAKQVRVVMELTVNTTTDSTEPAVPFANNSEDEIFYSLTGGRMSGGKESAFSPSEIRPSGSRDIWEMGPNSNKTLVRTLAEGKLGSDDRAVINVLVGEQDNAQREALKNLFVTIAQYGGDMIEKELGTEDTYDAFKGATQQEIVDATVELINDLGKRSDQAVGLFTISATRDELKVTAGDGVFSKVVASDSKTATVKLSGYGGAYTVKIRLEDASTARPASSVFLSEEYDKCGEDDLKVSGKTIKKGKTVTVAVPKPRFDWTCGGTLEHTTAPAPTNEVQVKRAASGRDITWRCFFSSTPDPDYTW
ncbi:hypothetical protein ACNOYE_38080 [Nannocystaceae bacterium ST9]